MAKQSFATQLAKGFVRSTVNQVGRQTGNVIANNMYGNAHSVPYRNAGGYNYNPNKNYTVSDPIEQTEPQFVDSSIWTKLFWVFFTLVGNFIGAPATFLNGLYIYVKQTVKCVNQSTHEVFIEDGRRKEGWRSLGIDTFTNQFLLSKAECPDNIWKAKQNLGKFYMIVGGIGILFYGAIIIFAG